MPRITGATSNEVYTKEAALPMLALANTDWLPILAHAERYRDFISHRDFFHSLVEGRVYLQINAYDLSDNPKAPVRELTRWLAANKLALYRLGYPRPQAPARDALRCGLAV